MAGIFALSEGLKMGRGLCCSDGSLIEPLDFLHLLFPNKGHQVVGDNVCFVPRPFSLPWLDIDSYLPAGATADDFFLPVELIDCLVSLTLITALVTMVMIIMKITWSKVDLQFAAITPTHKQWYVVANICKATTLLILTFSSRFWISTYRSIFDQFVNLETKRCVMVYIATDLAALYMVPKLPRSTIQHHVATVILSIIGSGINLSLKGWTGKVGVVKMFIIYGISSTPNFMVNAYLGIRVVYPKTKWGSLVSVSMYIYILCCAANWSIHGLWLAELVWNWDISIYVLLYLLPLYAMIHDDIKLINWLWKRGSFFN